MNPTRRGTVSHELLVVDDFRLVGHHNVVEHERVQVEHVDGVAVVGDHVAVVVDYLQRRVGRRMCGRGGRRRLVLWYGGGVETSRLQSGRLSRRRLTCYQRSTQRLHTTTASPFTHHTTNATTTTARLNSTRCHTGNQCRCCKTGVMWSDLLKRVQRDEGIEAKN